MRRHETTALGLTEDDPQLLRLVDEMAERLETDQPFDLNEFVVAHAAHEQELRRVFPAIRALVVADRPRWASSWTRHANRRHRCSRLELRAGSPYSRCHSSRNWATVIC